MEQAIKEFSRKIRDYHNKQLVTKLESILFAVFKIDELKLGILQDVDEILKKNNLTIYSTSGLKLKPEEYFENINQYVQVEYVESEHGIKHIENEKNIISSKGIIKESAGKISIAQSNSNIELFQHQINAIQELEKSYKNNLTRGLLVLPTGGGKTLTSIYWLLKNFINKEKKVIWIAHRHELLNQAKNTLNKLSFKDILPEIESFSFRVVSGLDSHDRAFDINKDDDIIISSKDSLRHGRQYLVNHFLKYHGDVLLVIDEAHHATARTYTDIIKIIEDNVSNFNLLGLTATPFRTAEKEAGYLSKVFKDGIIYSEDMKTLIIQGILSNPNFIPVETEENIELSEKDISLIKQMSNLPENIASQMAKRKNRNHKIVNYYKKDEFGKTIVFALNQIHAVELNSLFRKNGVSSDFIISGVKDPYLAINYSPKRNAEIIEKFKNNDLDVLINVQILTEGVDVPDANSVFLTRPTISKVLMNQMIGRALRGKRAGGTEKANIVFFIDDWKDKIDFISPKELFADENSQLTYEDSEYKKYQLQSISIRLLELFSNMLDETIENSKSLRAVPSLYLIPVGWYSFSVEKSGNIDESNFEHCKILVFANQFEAYKMMEKDMEEIFHRFDLDGNLILDEKERNQALLHIQKRYFENIYPFPAYRPSDILNFLEFYSQNNKQVPPYFTFVDREKLDISKEAKYIINTMSPQGKEIAYINSLWNSPNSIWKELYSNNKEKFISVIDLEKRKINYPEIYEKIEKPIIKYDEKLLEDLPLIEWPEPEQSQMRERVYGKAGLLKGQRRGYEVDHIYPREKGGKTVFENLRAILRPENREKSNKVI